MIPRRLHVPLACLLCALAVAVWHAGALRVPFLSDDYLMVRYLDRSSGAVRWDLVLGEFWSPWFGVRDMYRPLVSLSYGLELQLWGADPVWSHAVNVGLLAVATAAVCFTASRLVPQAAVLAALAAGTCMCAHPAGVEVTAWMAARTAGLELMFSALAWALLAVRAAGRLPAWPVWFCMLLALMSKEGALALPAVLLGLDVVLRGSAALRDRVLHLPLWLMLAAFLLWRLLILGLMTSGEPIQAMALLANLRSQAAAAVQPPESPFVLAWCGGFLVLVAVLARLHWRGAMLLAVAVLALVPVSRRGVGPDPWSGRLALAAVPALALAVAVAVTAVTARGRTWLRWPGLVGAVATVIAWAIGSERWQDHYRRGAETVTGLVRSLQSGASEGTARPLGLLRVDSGGVPVQLLHAKAWYLLAQRPFAPVDRPLLGLGCLLQRDEVSESVYFDLSPARALLDAGGAIAEWDHGALRSWERREVALPAGLAASPERPGTFMAPAPLPLFGVATVKVVLPEPGTGPWSLRLRALDARVSDGLLPVPGVAEPGGRVVWFDLQRALAPVWLAHLDAQWIGVDVAAGDRLVAGTAQVLPLPRPRLLPLAAPLEGREVVLMELAGRMQENALAAPLQAVILAPATVLSVVLQPGAALVLPPRVLGELGYMAGVAGPMPCWWFVQTPPGVPGEPGRSTLDRFVLRLEAR